MGKSKSDKPSTSGSGDKKKRKKKRSKRKSDSEDSDAESVHTSSSKQTEQQQQQQQNVQGLSEVEQAIVQLRMRGKQDPQLNFVAELRKIQDNISDLKGEDRRPVTAIPYKNNKEDTEDSDSDSDEEDEEKELKDMINRRLTTCMMLALSFESEENYPRDFYEKLGESEKFKEITQPFCKEEVEKLNELIKEKKKDARKRMEECKE